MEQLAECKCGREGAACRKAADAEWLEHQMAVCMRSSCVTCLSSPLSSLNLKEKGLQGVALSQSRVYHVGIILGIL